MSQLTHLDEAGRPAMVDVTAKEASLRTATAQGCVHCRSETLDKVLAGTVAKGSVIRTAEIAGIMAAKRTGELIPLCHPIALGKVAVTVEADSALPGFRVAAEVRTKAGTGVEMEALTAVSVACLTIFDMLKGVDRSMRIEGIAVTSKTGGRSGDWPAA
jgi:cyclic pyranopterin phosphate synthase